MVEDNKYEAKGRWFTCLIHLRRKHAAEVTHVVCYHGDRACFLAAENWRRTDSVKRCDSCIHMRVTDEVSLQ